MTSALQIRQCAFLVGGLGTRLGALTGGLPKPLTPVGGKPFLAYLLQHAHQCGIERVLLLAGHRAERIHDNLERLRETSGLGVSQLEIEVSIEPEPLGTAGALRFSADRMEDRLLLVNGDSLFLFDWSTMFASLGDGVDVELALRHEVDASRFGVVHLQGETVCAFSERGDERGGLINGGVYALTRAAVLACPPSGSFERDVLPALAARGCVRGRRQDGFFIDIGIPEALAAAQTSVPHALAYPPSA